MNLAELKKIIDRTIENAKIPAEDIHVEIGMDQKSICFEMHGTFYADTPYPCLVIVRGDVIGKACKAEREVAYLVKDIREG